MKFNKPSTTISEESNSQLPCYKKTIRIVAHEDNTYKSYVVKKGKFTIEKNKIKSLNHLWKIHKLTEKSRR